MVAMKEDMEIMKKNKINKIIIYSLLSCIIAIIIFLTISYFGKEEPVQKKDSSQSEKKQEQVEQMKDNKHDEDNNQSTEVKKEENSEKKDAESNNDNKGTRNGEKNIIRSSGNESQKNTKIQDYKGKKLSDSEGVGTTGKVFNSQKEALDFGKQEVKKLTEGDKKPRQFSISKVTAKDGSLVGWTVDIFEDNSVEKIVSNPTEDTEKNKDKE